MQKLQNTIYWAIIATEASHIFCCILPTLFSILGLLAGIGIIGLMPAWMTEFHETLHGWEVPVVIVSGIVVVLGWGLLFISRRIDCHDTGCEHGACAPKKDKAGLVLKIATVLFFVNVMIWGVFHRGMGLYTIEQPAEQTGYDHNAHEH